MEQPSIEVRRVYDEPDSRAGARILVDRLWPRGLRKDAAEITGWIKDAAPSAELRRWYGHDPDRFAQFRRRYLAELDGSEAQRGLQELRRLADDQPLTLLTATKDIELSHARVLAELLREIP